MRRAFSALSVLSSVLLTSGAPMPRQIQVNSPLRVRILSQPDLASIQLSANRNPSGSAITSDNLSLMLDGKRWIPRMGEFHYSRFDPKQWREELLKMKAGGIDIVSTYVFWIHHEEVRDQWDWKGQKNLRKFLQLCKELNLKAMVRGGPWAHGECRNGGLPDWLVKGYKTRTSDPAYLEQVKQLYGQIAKQIKGLSWAEGGPVVGFQVENEFYGPGSYFVALKQMALGVGIHVPIFTRTGWPLPSSPVAAGEVFPMFGGYPVGFWDRGTEETASKYANNYVISPIRNPDDIFQGTKPKGSKHDTSDTSIYPYLCCEIGGGMAMSYHRRPLVLPNEIGSLAFVKVASGAVLPGFYMYHGGTNPEGHLSYLNETQATGYWNDNPVKTYDFQAPLGEFGQVRDHYHLLRRMHLFLQDFGSEVGGMPTFMPDSAPKNSEDIKSLRWSVRSNGKSGVLFVNNFQRLKPMPERPGTQFCVQTETGEQVIPSTPITIPADSYFNWPIDWNLHGAVLRYATAQPICNLEEGDQANYFFASVPGIESEFVFDSKDVQVQTCLGKVDRTDSGIRALHVRQGLRPAIILRTSSGKKVRIFLLTNEQSLHLWKGNLGGTERVVVSKDNIQFDGDSLKVSNDSSLSAELAMMPSPKTLSYEDTTLIGEDQDGFGKFSIPEMQSSTNKVSFEQIQQPSKPREIHMGSQGVAEQPGDADFDGAGVWRIHLKRSRKPQRIIVQYRGDVARLYVGGKLVLDNFYNGTAMEFNPDAFGPDVYKKELLLKILPLKADAPIYLAPSVKAAIAGDQPICSLDKVESVKQLSTILRL